MENYKLRKLKAPDVFLVTTIISKIGIKKLKEAFTSQDVQSLVSKDSENTNAIGLAVVIELASIVCENLVNCQNDIYELLSRLSGINVNEFEDMEATLFLDMIVDVIKDNSKDFMKVVSRLLS